jgi:DnaJ like chaperone protein
VHPDELTTIESIAGYLGVSIADFNSLKAMYFKDTNSDYKILEIEPSASDEEVKKAYRKMAVKFHPDKVAALGEEVQHAAKEKFQKVQEAYENIKKHRGF